MAVFCTAANSILLKYVAVATILMPCEKFVFIFIFLVIECDLCYSAMKFSHWDCI